MALAQALSESRKEYQIKVRGTIDVSLVLSLGGELLGTATQKDMYLAGADTWRIREEAGQYVFAQKSHDRGTLARVKDVSERIITDTEAQDILRKRGVRVTVFKHRTLFRLHDSVLTLDVVEYLGNFVEIRSSNETELHRVLGLLGLKASAVLRESYLDLMMRRALPGWLRRLLVFHERMGVLAFGITSGILTTTGVLVGVNAAMASRRSIIAAITAIAVADSASDAFGMYMSKISQRGILKSEAMRYALWTFLGKFILPITFIVPLLVFTLSGAITVDLVWAGLLLAFLSMEQAIVAQSPVWKGVLRTLGLAVLIIVFARAAGSLTANLI